MLYNASRQYACAKNKPLYADHSSSKSLLPINIQDQCLSTQLKQLLCLRRN